MKYVKYVFLLIFYFLGSCASIENVNDREAVYFKKAGEITQEYENDIFTPEDSIGSSWSNLKLGFNYSIKVSSPPIDKYSIEKYVLVEIKDNAYIFNKYTDGGKSNFQVAYKNGYFYPNVFGGKLGKPGSWGCFPFEIGACDFIHVNRKKTLNISYENGIWTQMWLQTGLYGYATYRAIYDKKGILLYSWFYYENRLEPEFFGLHAIRERLKI